MIQTEYLFEYFDKGGNQAVTAMNPGWLTRIQNDTHWHHAESQNAPTPNCEIREKTLFLSRKLLLPDQKIRRVGLLLIYSSVTKLTTKY